MTTVCGTGETYVFAAKKKTLIYICKTSVKYTVLGIKSRDCLAQNQDNVSEWSNMFIHGLLVQ